MSNRPEISNNDGFDIFINNIKYLKGMPFAIKGKPRNAFKMLLQMSFGKDILKSLINILMQKRIIKRLNT